MLAFLDQWKQQTRRLKREVYALYVAYRDPRVPWYARLVVALVVAYAFSPIDLIPDVVPVLGYLDDLILLPLGIALALRLIPAAVMSDSRARADAILQQGKPVNKGAAIVIVLIWIALAVLAAWLVVRFVR